MEENSNHESQDKKVDDQTNKKEIEDGKAMAIIAYILAPIPYFAEKKNKFVRYHAVQGMNIFIIAVAYGIVAGIINSIVWNATAGNCVNSIFSGSYVGCTSGWGMAATVGWILGLIGLIIGILDIIGLVYAAQGQKKEVPILGKVKIIKK